MKVYLESLGCKLNQCERDALALEFAAAGHTIVDSAADADLCVVNTCAVTHTAATKSRGRLRTLHRLNPQARLVAAGCYVTTGQDGIRADMEVDNAHKADLVSLVEAQAPMWDLAAGSRPGGPAPDSEFSHRTRPMVKIQDGCDNACTYCIVHLLRGRQRSSPRDEIVDRVSHLVRLGYHEVVLTGVHVGAYGRDSSDSLSGLVRALLDRTGVERLRLSSIEPWDIAPDFFDLWQDPRLCRHLHLPLQSGCDRTLRRMNRSYTTADYADLAARARAAIPGLALTTDLIAGFPGETGEEFAASAAFIERMAFARAHVFAYSPRPGTPASAMPEQVDPRQRDERARRLRQVAARSGAAFRRSFLGQTLPVLWEARQRDGRWSGLTDNYIRVWTRCPDELANTVRPAMLEALDAAGVSGRLV